MPVIHLIDTAGEVDGCGPGGTIAGDSNCLFNAVIRDIDVSTGTGEIGPPSGFNSARLQTAAWRTSRSLPREASRGIEGTPATSDWVNISVTGGQYGVMFDGGDCGSASVAGLTLRGQTLVGVYGGPNATDSTEIARRQLRHDHARWLRHSESSAVPIELFPIWSANVSSASFVDGHIVASKSAATSPTAQTLTLYIYNVYAEAQATLIQGSSGGLSASGNLDLIEEYSHTDPTATPSTQEVPQASYNVLDGTQSQTDPAPSVKTSVASCHRRPRPAPPAGALALDHRPWDRGRHDVRSGPDRVQGLHRRNSRPPSRPATKCSCPAGTLHLRDDTAPAEHADLWCPGLSHADHGLSLARDSRHVSALHSHLCRRRADVRRRPPARLAQARPQTNPTWRPSSGRRAQLDQNRVAIGNLEWTMTPSRGPQSSWHVSSTTAGAAETRCAVPGQHGSCVPATVEFGSSPSSLRGTP